MKFVSGLSIRHSELVIFVHPKEMHFYENVVRKREKSASQPAFKLWCTAMLSLGYSCLPLQDTIVFRHGLLYPIRRFDAPTHFGIRYCARTERAPRRRRMMNEILVAIGFSSAIGAMYAVVHLLYQRERAARPGACRSDADACAHCGCCSFHRPQDANEPLPPQPLTEKGNTYE